MKGWQFTNTHEPLVLADIVEPVAGPGEVLIDIKAAGLCHSDVGMLEDPQWLQTLAFKPIVIGHEVAGVVTAVGEGVTDIKVGDRVGVCPTATGGAPGYARNGGFTFKHVAPAADVVKMPEGLSFELAAMGTDAGMTSYHAMVIRGGAKAGMKVGVIGFGGLGQIGARVAAVLGAELHVAEPNKAVWDAAKTAGATSVVENADEWAGKDFDLVVDYAGYGVTTRAAAKAVKFGGKVVLVGMAKLEFTIDTMDMILKELNILGSVGGTKEDIAAIYDLMSQGKVDPKFTVINFEDIPQGIDDLKHHRITGRLVAHIAS